MVVTTDPTIADLLSSGSSYFLRLWSMSRWVHIEVGSIVELDGQEPSCRKGFWTLESRPEVCSSLVRYCGLQVLTEVRTKRTTLRLGFTVFNPEWYL